MIFKNYFFVVIISTAVHKIYSGDFLSKFHQSGYKIKNCRAEVTYINKNYMEKIELTTYKFNRSVPAINVTFIAKRDMKDKLEIVVQAYKFASNEYRRFPIRYQVNYCKVFNLNVYGLMNALKCGNVRSCMWEKGVVYRVCNFVIDDTLFPPVIPTGQYKVEAALTYFETEIASTNAYGEVYVPIQIK